MSTIFHRTLAPLKKILPAAIWQPMRSAVTAFITPIRFSILTGHFSSSLAMRATTRDGQPLPWYTYPAIDFLAQRNFSGRRILEFGGGQSTLWWSARAESVMTIEEDFDWHNYIKKNVGDNVEVFHVPADSVSRNIDDVLSVIGRFGSIKFDIIVIDGHLRSEIASVAFQFLGEGGAIIFDNSDGYDCHMRTKDLDCQRVDFYGFSPGVSLRNCTSLFFRGKCFLLDPQIEIVSGEEVGRVLLQVESRP